MSRLMRHVLLAAAALVMAGAQAQQAADVPKGPLAGFVAPADPKPDESNAARAKSQPGNNAPMWRAVRESGLQEGVVNLPGAEKGVLIQPLVQYPGSRYASAGEAWRQVRNRWIIPYGGSLLLILLLAIALFHWRKGPLGHSHADGPPVIERFTPFERATHWANGAAFVVLGVSGLVMAFGKFFLLPVIGATLFGWLTYALKTAHNFAGPLFAVSTLVMIVTFARDNLPRKGDGRWLIKGGGLLSDGDEIPSHRFNAAEKVLFWLGVFLIGMVVIASGLVLDKLVPGLAYLRGDMQIAHMIHAVAAGLMLALFIGHIYIGTIGMKGAHRAMRTGYVDEAWAREHHLWWAEDIRAGKIPARRSNEAAPNLQTAKEGA
jgi:formate dehydrogenase subunit gamma